MTTMMTNAALAAALHSAREQLDRARWRLRGAQTALGRGQELSVKKRTTLERIIEADRAAQAAHARSVATALVDGAQPPREVTDERAIRDRMAAEREQQIADQALEQLRAAAAAAEADARNAEAAVHQAADAVIGEKARTLIAEAEGHLAALERIAEELWAFIPSSASELASPLACLAEVRAAIERLPKRDPHQTAVNLLNGGREYPGRVSEMRAELIEGASVVEQPAATIEAAAA